MPLDSVFYRHNSPGSSRAAQIARQKMHSKQIKQHVITKSVAPYVETRWTCEQFRGGGSCLALVPQATGADLGICVREGGTLPAQQGVWGSAVSSPIGAWGGAPEANAFCVQKNSKNYTKKRRPGGL